MKQTLSLLLLALPALAIAEVPAKRLNDAATVISEVMSAPDKGIPSNLLARAQCVIVVPGMKQGAFGFGAKYGKGFFSCRKGGDWSAPASVRVEGGSVGFQIGLIETDVVLPVKSGSLKLMLYSL